MSTAFELFQAAKGFILLDPHNAYDLDQLKKTFNTHIGHCEYLVILSGLTVGPATFQTLMNSVFNQFAFEYVLFV